MSKKLKKVVMFGAVLALLLPSFPAGISARDAVAEPTAQDAQAVDPIELAGIALGEATPADTGQPPDGSKRALAESLIGGVGTPSLESLGGEAVEGLDLDITDGGGLAAPPPLRASSSGGGGASFAVAAAGNDNPNYPIGLNLNTYYQQTLTPAGSSRWFATVTTAATTRLTTILVMVPTVDFDLYVYKLNGNVLNLVAYSYAGAAGVEEVCRYMAAPGTYFFMVQSYSGAGDFAIYNLASTAYDSHELNDTQNTATPVSFPNGISDTTITGSIDTIYDYDYYFLTFPSQTTLVLCLNPLDTDYRMAIVDGGGNATMLPNARRITLTAPNGNPDDPVGLYVLVRSPSLAYDEMKNYSLSISEPDDRAGYTTIFENFDRSIVVDVPSAPGSGIVTIDPLNTYVNGHRLHLSGFQVIYKDDNHRDLLCFQGNSLDHGVANFYNAKVHVWHSQQIFPATYSTNLPGKTKVFTAQNPALIIGLCGVYASSLRGLIANPAWDITENYATLVIDPSDGLIYDVITPNGLYDFHFNQFSLTKLDNYYCYF
ncbi:MAG: hypothetical protein LBG71_01400 [Clostridiales Family XIII bacterium]|jgi:hypothetical protein|nr:hypothetical protein [Clostridiales Family XIII bacterium]